MCFCYSGSFYETFLLIGNVCLRLLPVSSSMKYFSSLCISLMFLISFDVLFDVVVDLFVVVINLFDVILGVHCRCLTWLYTECWSWQWNWAMPLSHLRSYSSTLAHSINFMVWTTTTLSYSHTDHLQIVPHHTCVLHEYIMCAHTCRYNMGVSAIPSMFTYFT